MLNPIVESRHVSHACGDGRVVWIPDSTPEATIRAMITRNGGETVKLP